MYLRQRVAVYLRHTVAQNMLILRILHKLGVMVRIMLVVLRDHRDNETHHQMSGVHSPT